MSSYVGEIAALATAFCWSLTSTFFSIAGRAVGSVVVNRARLVLAVFFLALTHLLIQGELLPVHAEPSRWWWLGCSGIIGLALGDSCLFQALVLVGPHLSMLLMSLVPVVSTLVAWAYLNEAMNPVKLGAVLLTVGGIMLVVWAKRDLGITNDHRHYWIGILCGFGGAVGQAFGLITAKKGLAGDFSGLSATLIRVSVATVAIWIFTFIRGEVRSTFQRLSNRKATISIAAGAFAGPFLGIWLSMVAIKWTYVGVASTLMALTPIMLLPISYWIFGERITVWSIVGTIVAVAGTALIFLT